MILSKRFLLSFCLSLSCFCSGIADRVVSLDQKQAIDMLQRFYTTYISNLLHDDEAANVVLKRHHLVCELEETVDEMPQQKDGNGLLRTQKVSEQMLETLQIFPLGNDWFLVRFQGDEPTEIPVKVVREKGKWMIRYIVPESKGRAYGDQLLSGHEGQGIALPIAADALKNAYANLVVHPGVASYERDFFEAFPRTWDEFVLTYDYLPPYDGNLYFYAWEHLEAFCNLSSVPEHEYADRLIALCQGGHWDADGINYLQDILRNYTMAHVSLMLEHLEVLGTDAFYFWQFFFQSPVKNKDDVLPKHYAILRQALLKHPKLSVEDLDLAFKVSYGRAMLRGRCYPSFLLRD